MDSNDAWRTETETCEHCHGTGSVPKRCPLCRSTGHVGRVEHHGPPECGSSSYIAVPCPNGCPDTRLVMWEGDHA